VDRFKNTTDNTKLESFHAIFKREEIYVDSYKTFEKTKIKMFEF